jgi:hypothetical protein
MVVYKVQGWVIKYSRKNGIQYLLNEVRFFYDVDSATETFETQKNQVIITCQSGKNLKGFATLVKCEGEKGQIFGGDELLRFEY